VSPDDSDEAGIFQIHADVRFRPFPLPVPHITDVGAGASDPTKGQRRFPNVVTGVFARAGQLPSGLSQQRGITYRPLVVRSTAACPLLLSELLMSSGIQSGMAGTGAVAMELLWQIIIRRTRLQG